MAEKRARKRTAPAIGYVRVSTDEQAREGISPAAQEDKIRAYCDLNDIELAEILIDAGESAKTLERPAMQEALRRIRAGKVGALIVYKLDRLTRSPRDLYMLIDDELNPRAIDLISMQEQIDTRTPAGRGMLGVMSVFAQMERELIAERTREALAHKKRQGHRLGTTPYGFVTPEPGAEMEPNADELKAVRMILRRRHSGKSFRAIADELEEKGLSTKRGGKWYPATVRGVWLARQRYKLHLSLVA